jgi:Zn-finger nucleic acid-binding protein
MKCPTDNATLVMSERAGIEIDYCPDCRGVWLDRGELDKILERATADVSTAVPAPGQPPYAEPQYNQPRYDNGPAQQPYRKKKKEHWLTELFD